MRALMRRIWSFLDHLGRAILAWQLGGSFVIIALLGWAIAAYDVIPTPFLVLLLVGIFFLAFALLGVTMPHVLSQIPAPRETREGQAPSLQGEHPDRSPSIQKIRLIRNEINEGAATARRAVGVPQVFELVSDTNWIAHRNELAAISEAGDAHRLAGTAWQGLYRYNNAVKGRAHISNEDLEAIAADALRAVDALGVAADALRSR